MADFRKPALQLQLDFTPEEQKYIRRFVAILGREGSLRAFVKTAIKNEIKNILAAMPEEKRERIAELFDGVR
jgi:hypothetical protein